ncbi:hypothetical protein [Streptomyces sp. MN13]
MQQKLRERREKAALNSVVAGLGPLLTGNALVPDAVPEWIPQAIARTWELSAEPVELLSDDSSPEELDAWLASLLTAHNLTARLYVATHLGIRPWLECHVLPHNRTARLREVIEEPWMFLSSSLDTLLIVSEAEYHYEAYVARADDQGG